MQQRWTVPGVQRAITEGFVQEKVLPVSYPNFSGHFTGSRGFLPGQKYGGWNDFLDVSTTPGRPPYVRGTFRTCQAYDPNLFFAHDSCWSGAVNGPVQRNGAGASQLLITVNGFVPGMLPNSTIPLRVSLARGNPDAIQGTLQFPAGLAGTPPLEPVSFQGRVAGVDVQQEVYVYNWTDKLPKDTVNGATLKLGRLMVDKCESLLLSSETAATASCKTHVQLTSAAEAILGQRPTDQSMGAFFGKQPDGVWVCTRVSYSPPQYNILQ
jgi:hypothetical protein